MVNKVISVPIKFNGTVRDFILMNNEKYKFYSDINEVKTVN